MIIAFAIVGLCGWYVRKSLLGRTKKGKEFLRSSDPGDWVNQDPNAIDKSGAVDEKLDYENDDGDGNARIENTMSRRLSGAAAATAAGADGMMHVQPGVGAYNARSLPASPNGYTSPRSSSIPSSTGATEFGGMYPSAGNAVLANTAPATPGRRQQQHASMQSMRQYDDIQSSLAYPSNLATQAVTSPGYNVHPQHYSQMQMQHQLQGYQGGYVHPFAQVPAHMQVQPHQMEYNQQPHEQMHMQQQSQQQMSSGVPFGAPLPPLPHHDPYTTPRNSFQPPLSSSSQSTGLDSNIANHSHHGGVTDSPYPESIHNSPDTVNAVGTPDVTGAGGGTVKHQSIPFILPPQPTPVSAGHGSFRESQQMNASPRQMQHGQSGSLNGIPRSLTAGHGRFSSSSSISQGSPTAVSGDGGQNEEQLQKRATQQVAQGVPLPISPPIRSASLPMPGSANEPAQKIDQVVSQQANEKEAAQGSEVINQKKEGDEQGRTSTEGLPYLS